MADERALDLRLAGIHLRAGSTWLARAELEAAAGAGALDREALADLAEARWRTGDLAAGAAAAGAHLEAGGTSAAALVVAAEAAAAEGRDADARELVGRAVAAAGGAAALWTLSGGLATRAPWPADVAAASGSERHAEARLAGTMDGAGQLEAAARDLAAGRDEDASVRLAVVLRVAPELAAAVLGLLADHERPELDLVRGDALRIVGHETEALRAFAAAVEAVGSASTSDGPRRAR